VDNQTNSQEPLTAHNIHAVMVDKGFWQPFIDGKVTNNERIVEQVLHMVTEALEWLTADNEQEQLEEAADVLIVLMDLCGGLGLAFSLDSYPPVAHKTLDPVLAVCKLANAVRKEGEFTKGHVADVVKAMYSNWGKAYILAAVDAKMTKNKARPYQYGKQALKLQLL